MVKTATVFGGKRTLAAIGRPRLHRAPLRPQRSDRGRADHLAVEELGRRAHRSAELASISSRENASPPGRHPRARSSHPWREAARRWRRRCGGSRSGLRPGRPGRPRPGGSGRRSRRPLRDALELDRLREDVAELLKRKQLADAAVSWRAASIRRASAVNGLAFEAADSERKRPRPAPRPRRRRAGEERVERDERPGETVLAMVRARGWRGWTEAAAGQGRPWRRGRWNLVSSPVNHAKESRKPHLFGDRAAFG